MTSENLESAGKATGFARPAVLCLLLIAVTLAVYWPVVHCDFLNLDDTDYFTANHHVQTGLKPANIVWAFTTRHASNWHPLTWLSLMLDAELFGKGPFGPHFTNLLLHAANTASAFPVAPALDGGNLAECGRRGAVCLASVARGIGGVGCGTQGCSEHVLRIAVTVGLCVLCVRKVQGS